MPDEFDSLFTPAFFSIPVNLEKQKVIIPFSVPSSPDDVNNFFSNEKNRILYHEGVRGLIGQLGKWVEENNIAFAPLFIESATVNRVVTDAKDAILYFYQAQLEQGSLSNTASDNYDLYVRGVEYLITILQLLQSEDISLEVRTRIITTSISVLPGSLTPLDVLKSTVLQLEIKSPLPQSPELLESFISSPEYAFFLARVKELIDQLGVWAETHKLKPQPIDVEVFEMVKVMEVVDDVEVMKEVRQRKIVTLNDVRAYLNNFLKENIKEIIINHESSSHYRQDVFNLYTAGFTFLQTIIGIINTDDVSLDVRINVITPLISSLLCPPGAFGALQTACLQLQSDLPRQLMGIRKEVAEQVAMDIIRQNSNLLEAVGSETHVVRRFLLNAASILGIEVAEDTYAPEVIDEDICTDFLDDVMATLTANKVIDMLIDKLDVADLSQRLSKDWKALEYIEELLKKYGTDDGFNRFHLIDSAAPQVLRDEIYYYLYITIFQRLIKSDYLDIEGKTELKQIDSNILIFQSSHSLKFAYVLQDSPDPGEMRVPFIPYCLKQVLAGNFSWLHAIENPGQQEELCEVLLKAVVLALQDGSANLEIIVGLLRDETIRPYLTLHLELLLDVLALVPKPLREPLLGSSALALDIRKISTPRELAKLLLLSDPENWMQQYQHYRVEIIKDAYNLDEFFKCLKARFDRESVIPTIFILDLMGNFPEQIRNILKRKSQVIRILNHIPINKKSDFIEKTLGTSLFKSLLTKSDDLVFFLSELEKELHLVFLQTIAGELSLLTYSYHDLAALLKVCSSSAKLFFLNSIVRYSPIINTKDQLISIINEVPSLERWKFFSTKLFPNHARRLIMNFEELKGVIELFPQENREEFIEFLTANYIAALITDRYQLNDFLEKIPPETYLLLIQGFDQSQLCKVIDRGGDFYKYLLAMPELDRYAYLMNFPPQHLVFLIKDQNHLDKILCHVPEEDRLYFLREIIRKDFFLQESSPHPNIFLILNLLSESHRLEFLRDILPKDTVSKVFHAAKDVLTITETLPLSQRLEFLRDIVDSRIFSTLNFGLDEINQLLEKIPQPQRLEFLRDVVGDSLPKIISKEMIYGIPQRMLDPAITESFFKLLNKVLPFARIDLLRQIGYPSLAKWIQDASTLVRLTELLPSEYRLEMMVGILKNNNGIALHPFPDILRIFSEAEVGNFFRSLGKPFFESYRPTRDRFVELVNLLPTTYLTEFLNSINCEHFKREWCNYWVILVDLKKVDEFRRFPIIEKISQAIPEFFKDFYVLISLLPLLPSYDRRLMVDLLSSEQKQLLLNDLQAIASVMRLLPEESRLLFVTSLPASSYKLVANPSDFVYILRLLPLDSRELASIYFNDFVFTRRYEITDILDLLPEEKRFDWLKKNVDIGFLKELCKEVWTIESLAKSLGLSQRPFLFKYLSENLNDTEMAQYKYSSAVFAELQQWRGASVSTQGMFGPTVVVEVAVQTDERAYKEAQVQTEETFLAVGSLGAR